MPCVPLKIPEGFPESYPDPRADFRQRHPVLGRLFGGLLKDKWGVLEDEIAEALEARNMTLEEAWCEHPDLMDLVRLLQGIFREFLWLKDIVFIPEDRYWIIGQIVTGDLCEIEALMAIEEELDIEFQENDILEHTTMLDFVRLLKGRSAHRVGRAYPGPQLDR